MSSINNLKTAIVTKYPEWDIQFREVPVPAGSGYYLDIRVKAKKDRISSLPKRINKEFWTKTESIVLEPEKYFEHRQVIKKPWYHNVFLAILEVNPDYTEEELVGEIIYYDDDGCVDSCWNTNVVEDIKYTETIIPEVVDPNYSYYHFYVMIDEVESQAPTILKEIDYLLE